MIQLCKVNQQNIRFLHYCTSLIFSVFYVFQTAYVHHTEDHLYIQFLGCLVYVDTSGCCMAIATQQPDVSAYTGLYQMRCTAYKVAPDDRQI